MSESLQKRIRDRALEGPEEKALAWYRDGLDLSWLSRHELVETAESYATRLRDEGLRPGDVCLVVMSSDEECALTLLAILFCGGLPLLMAPPRLHSDRAESSLFQNIAHVARKARPKLVVVRAGMEGLMNRLGEESQGAKVVLVGPEWGEARSKEGMPSIQVTPEQWAMLQLTSGTTGKPRICVWKHANVLASIDGMAKAMALQETDVFFNWTPLYHDMGLMVNFLLCLAEGIPLVMMKPEDVIKSPAAWLRGLSESRATVTWSPNFGYALCARRVTPAEVEGLCLEGVRAFWNAAERIHHRTMIEFFEKFESVGVRWDRLKTNFGCAENIGGATFSDPCSAVRIDEIDRALFLRDRLARPCERGIDGGRALSVVSVGRPFPGMDVAVFSESGSELSDGEVGRLGFRSPSRMAGYLEDAQRTLTGSYEEWLMTGDEGYLRDGEVFWVGRTEERLNVYGVKLDPSDFEAVLFEIPGLRSGCFAAFGVDEPSMGTQRAVIVCEVAAALTEAAREKWMASIRGEVARCLGVMISEVILVPSKTLPKTSSGKRRHRHVKELYLAGWFQEWELSVGGTDVASSAVGRVEGLLTKE